MDCMDRRIASANTSTSTAAEEHPSFLRHQVTVGNCHGHYHRAFHAFNRLLRWSLQNQTAGFLRHFVRERTAKYNVMKQTLRHWIVTCASWSFTPAAVAMWLLVVLTKPGKRLSSSLYSLSVSLSVRLSVGLSLHGYLSTSFPV